MRSRFTQANQERLLEEAKNLREQAKLLPHGPVRAAAIKKARQAEIAARLGEWANSPGLRPPKKDDPSSTV